MAVHNSPSMSAALSESMKYKIMQVCAKALYTPIPTMIWEVTMNITKLAALSNFPHMFLCIKIHAQNTLKLDVDLTSSWSDV